MTSSSAFLLPTEWPDASLAEIASITPIQELKWPLLNDRGIKIAVKREDQLHPQLGGNKFYKLHGHLQKFPQNQATVLVTFGGAYSNHIAATAAACQRLEIPAIGIIRGHQKTPSHTLVTASAHGMKLLYVSREQYRLKEEENWLQEMQETIGESVYWVPEGGGDALGSQGCAQWASQTIAASDWHPTHLCTAAGTGGTASGILAASENSSVHAFLALKGSPSETLAMREKILSQAKAVRDFGPHAALANPELVLETDYHCGGYARFPQSLREFMLSFQNEFNMLLDPVYTAKLFWGISQKALKNEWPEGSRLLAFHTGGLQGRCGFPEL